MILQKENKTQQSICTNGSSSVTSNIDILSAGTVKDMYVGVDINHQNVENLSVKLLSPTGTELVLHNQTPKHEPNLQVKYSRELLDSFIGEEANGQWKLQVSSNEIDLEGKLNSWVIGMSCSGDEEKPSNIYLGENNINGLSSKQYCQLEGVVSGITLDLHVDHPQTGDLTVQLLSPSGKTVAVHNRKGGDRKNLRATYNRVTLKEMLGEQAKGEWTLILKDHSGKDLGSLKSWKLELNVRKNNDLTRIEGIGPEIQRLLYASGINTYSRLATTSSATIQKIMQGAGARYQLEDTSTWAQQAHMAALNQWGNLRVLLNK